MFRFLGLKLPNMDYSNLLPLPSFRPPFSLTDYLLVLPEVPRKRRGGGDIQCSRVSSRRFASDYDPEGKLARTVTRTRNSSFAFYVFFSLFGRPAFSSMS